MSESIPLPEGVLVAWYGDDFTGSSAVLEVLTFGGVPSVLFLDVPTEEQLATFAHCRGVGIAGIARSQSPEWMEENLPRYFEALRRIQAPITQYKICSTFDSSPRVGSIGKALDVAAPMFDGRWYPLIVAAPPINRYQAFGNLFAGVNNVTHRLDRHPTMSRHPVTPMTEADVRVHLSGQTDKAIGLVDLQALRSQSSSNALHMELGSGAVIVAIDSIDEADLEAAGRLIWENRGTGLFTIASQGLEYALIAYWREAGLLGQKPAPQVAPTDRIVVVSGSCAPQNATQIRWAVERGFAPVALDAALVVDELAWQGELQRAIADALSAAGNGRDPLVYTALGPDDPSIAALNTAASTTGVASAELNAKIGKGLGHIFDRVRRSLNVTRGVIAGGDTSGHASSVLGIQAFEALVPIAPGAPLMKAHSKELASRGLEIALKGGQMGAPDYFGLVKEGGARTSRL